MINYICIKTKEENKQIQDDSDSCFEKEDDLEGRLDARVTSGIRELLLDGKGFFRPRGKFMLQLPDLQAFQPCLRNSKVINRSRIRTYSQT